MRAGGSFVVSTSDTAADVAEVELLVAAFGMSAVLAAAAPADGGSWLVEIYADGPTEPLEQIEATVRVLVAEAVRRRLSLEPVRSAAVA